MLNKTFLLCRFQQLKNISHINLLNKRKFTTNYKQYRIQSCVCRQLNLYQRHDLFRNMRVHSTQSDHRQKAVIETSVPKIVIEDHKVLDDKIIDNTVKEVWMKKVDPYVKLARWDKPIGVYLLYWPGSWAIALGSIPGNLPLQTSLEMAGLFLLGAGLMRGAGCTINDMWDKDVDRQVERTKDRPLASGAVSSKQALVFLGGQLALALGVLLQLNCYSVLLGAGSMFFVVTYPLAKRFTNYPQIFLGATFNWGALLGYSALQGKIEPAVCLPLYVGALAWTVIYDTIYAHQDKEDDARIGMKSTALTFGSHTKPALTAALITSSLCFASAGYAANLDYEFYLALLAYLGHVGRQIHTLKMDSPDDCAKKFKSNSLVGLIILLGILAGGHRQYKQNREKHRGVESLSTAKSCVFG